MASASTATRPGPARLIPALGWISAYRPAMLPADLLAGLTLWGMLVPEGIAYAQLAGAPVEAGLYTLLVSLALYCLLGSSRLLVCAATSSSSIMMAAVVFPLAGHDPAATAVYLFLVVGLVGLVFVLAGVLRLGFVSDFLSEPVMTGFVFGMAIYIATSQATKLLGLPRLHGETLSQLAHLAAHLGQVSPASAALGLGALAGLFVLERAAPRLPGALLILAGSTFLVWATGLDAGAGVAVVGFLPSGLPHVGLPRLAWAELTAMVPGALAVALVTFSQALGTARAFAGDQADQIDPNRELLAMGLANLGAGLLGGLVNGGSMSSTAVNARAGAKSQISGLTAAAMVGFTLLALTPLFRTLPEAVLAAMVIHAVVRLMKVRELRRLLALRPGEFGLALVALFGVIGLSISAGLLLAVAASILRLVWRSSRVPVSELGRLPGCEAYVARERHPEAECLPGVLALRLDGPLFFANAPRLRERILGRLAADSGIRAVILDLKANADLDVTALDTLFSLAEALGRRGLELWFAEVGESVRDTLRRAGFEAKIGARRFLPDLASAIRAAGAGPGLSAST